MQSLKHALRMAFSAILWGLLAGLGLDAVLQRRRDMRTARRVGRCVNGMTNAAAKPTRYVYGKRCE